LEIARQLKQVPPTVGVMIALFDGEDYGPHEPDMYLGAKHFAKSLREHQLEYGILLDMVGGKAMSLPAEGNSVIHAPKVVSRIVKAAADLGYDGVFNSIPKYYVEDDHLPLNKAGLPCADIIDLDYAHWHLTSDTPENCDQKSLEIVGKTLLRLLEKYP